MATERGWFVVALWALGSVGVVLIFCAIGFIFDVLRFAADRKQPQLPLLVRKHAVRERLVGRDAA